MPITKKPYKCENEIQAQILTLYQQYTQFVYQ